MNDHQKQIYRYLLDRIAAGEILIGEKLPTENQLAEQFSTGRLNAHYGGQGARAGGHPPLRPAARHHSAALPAGVRARPASAAGQPQGVRTQSQSAQLPNIHWNDRILIPLRTMLARHRIDFEERLIDDTMTPERYQQMLFELIRQGCGGLVVVPGGNWDRILADRPELLFRFPQPYSPLRPRRNHAGLLLVQYRRHQQHQRRRTRFGNRDEHSPRRESSSACSGVKHARFQLERFRGVEESMPPLRAAGGKAHHLSAGYERTLFTVLRKISAPIPPSSPATIAPPSG